MALVPRYGSPLTAREGQALDLVCAGYTDRQIAADMGITEHTIHNHMTNVRSKLGAQSRTQAAVMWLALRDGYARLWELEAGARAVAQALPTPPPLPASPRGPGEKFWALVEKRADGCWRWLGPLDGAQARPLCTIRGLERLGRSARRIAWALDRGEVLPGDVYLQRDLARCGLQTCINPGHMEPGVRGDGSPWRAQALGRAYADHLANRAGAP